MQKPVHPLRTPALRTSASWKTSITPCATSATTTSQGLRLKPATANPKKNRGDGHLGPQDFAAAIDDGEQHAVRGGGHEHDGMEHALTIHAQPSGRAADEQREGDADDKFHVSVSELMTFHQQTCIQGKVGSRRNPPV